MRVTLEKAVNRGLLYAIVFALMCACTAAHRERFPDLERASRDIVAVLSSNGSLDRYRAAAAQFSAALSSASASSAEGRRRLDEYREANKGLQDILAVWETKNARQQELLPLSSPLASRLAKEWDLPVNTNEPPSIYASEAMQTIWTATRTKIEALDEDRSGG